MEDDYTSPNSLSNLTHVPSATNNNTIISDIEYYSDNIFDNESKSNSFANAINEEEKEKKIF